MSEIILPIQGEKRAQLNTYTAMA